MTARQTVRRAIVDDDADLLAAAGLIDQARIDDLRETLTTTLRQLNYDRAQAAGERERADVLQRLEALTPSVDDQQRGTHEAVGSPGSIRNTASGESSHER